MFKFVWPWSFLLLMIPWLLYRVFPQTKPQRSLSLKIPFFENVTKYQPSLASSLPHTNYFKWAYLLWTLIIFALANPQWIGAPLLLRQQGHDIMLAIDISGSMEIPDLTWHHQPIDRLTVVKKLAKKFVTQRKGDRVGLILFGSFAYLQTPLTYDRNTVRLQLNDASIGLAGPQTAIGDAIVLAVKRLMKQPNTMRILILLSDGANNSGKILPQQGLALAKQHHVRIYTIGLGADNLRVSSVFGSRMINPAADLDETLLKQLADETGGMYFRAKDTMSLEAIYKQIDALEPIIHEDRVFRSIRYLYWWPLGLAFITSLILVGFYLVKLKYFEKIERTT